MDLRTFDVAHLSVLPISPQHILSVRLRYLLNYANFLQEYLPASAIGLMPSLTLLRHPSHDADTMPRDV